MIHYAKSFSDDLNDPRFVRIFWCCNVVEKIALEAVLWLQKIHNIWRLDALLHKEHALSPKYTVPFLRCKG